MAKKSLNLEIFELEQLDNNQTSVSLMPCPCGAAGGWVCGVVRAVWYVIKILHP